MRKLLLKVALATGVLLTASNAARSELIVNGSFEQGEYLADPVDGSFETISAGDARLTGWTIGGKGVNRHLAAPGFTPANSGAYMIDLNLDGGGLDETGTLSQSFATTVGAVYRLQFSMAGPDPSLGDPRLVRVEIAGLDYVYGFQASETDAILWGRATLDFIAVDATTTLTFSSVDGEGYWGAFLDDVSVVAVPEPAGVTLLGLASLGLLAAARRRRAD